MYIELSYESLVTNTESEAKRSFAFLGLPREQEILAVQTRSASSTASASQIRRAIYSIFSILNGDLNNSVIPFDVHLKGTEFGLDGVAILVQGQLCVDSDEVAAVVDRNSNIDFVFFQSKRSEKFDYGDIAKFIDGVCGFFDGTMDAESDQLDDLIAAKAEIYNAPLRRNPRVRCFYVSTGSYEPTDRIEKLLDLGRSRLREMNLFDEVDIELVGAKRLQNSYRLATNSNSATIEFSKCQTLPTHDSVEEAYIGYIGANELLNLVTVNSDDGSSNRCLVGRLGND